MSGRQNHLAGQKSPYLLQHVDNPVDWYPWGAEALEKARKEQKPVLLSIGYSTCHWCHVMAHESFESEQIAKILNESFVSIKVDREERPDLDQIYMTAVSALTGHGGWPLTAFLTPDGKPFYGGTYFPPVAKFGSPGFGELLLTIARAWSEQRDQITASAHEITKLLEQQNGRFTASSQLPEAHLLELASRNITAQFDPNNGGFGHAPKFPMGHYVSYLLRYYKRTRGREILDIIEHTLDAMAEGGIYDHLGGGFHRYSTDAKWHIPHFEKMLYDQALLVKTYVEAYQVTGSLKYAVIIQETLDYVLRDMQQPQGGFYSAEDADSLSDNGHKVEGAFYVFSKTEIEQVLGAEDTTVFNYVFGVQDNGNAEHDPHGEFTGKNILYLAKSSSETASHFKKDEAAVKRLIQEGKDKLFAYRSKRPRPHLDDKVLTDWNGLIIGALAAAGMVLNKPEYVKAAQKAADFILANLNANGRLLHSYREGPSKILGTLEDYAFFANGLLDLYEASFEQKYFNEALRLAGDMQKLFEDPQGGFFLTATDAETLIVRPKEIYDGAIPSGNSAAALLLQRLYLMTSDERWIKSLEALLKVFLETIEKSPAAYTFAMAAIDAYIGPGCRITLGGKPSDEALVRMRQLAYKHFIPNKALLYHSNDTTATATVCHGNTCQLPVKELNLLEEQLLNS